MVSEFGIAGVIFFLSLALTFGAAFYGRVRARPETGEEDLAGRRLNRWLIGLSAGATGNSGFIVTGAVGLGFAGGVQWLMLPIGWMIGDLFYWWFFPAKLNRLARDAGATTISQILTFDLSGPAKRWLAAIIAILLAIFLSAYASAQWLAGRKFLLGVFDLSDLSALILFSLTIVIYSALGGFRGSVYADTLQAVIRIFGTIIAVGAVLWFATADPVSFAVNIKAAGPNFLNPFPQPTVIAAVGFAVGYAFAAVGFGLGQPQIITRYFAGQSPEETRAAWWIYIGFVQFTWIAMTCFGVLLRGVMPGIADPETGLSLFFKANVSPMITGIIFADVYATIASTSNSLLVAIGQTIQHDILSGLRGTKDVTRTTPFWLIFMVGVATIGLSLVMPGNVFSIALGAVSKIGAAVAGPVLIKVLNWRHSAQSLLVAVVFGIGVAYVWEYLGYASTFNESGIGLAMSILANAVFVRMFSSRKNP